MSLTTGLPWNSQSVASKGMLVSPGLKMHLIGISNKIEVLLAKKHIGWLEELAFIASRLISLVRICTVCITLLP